MVEGWLVIAIKTFYPLCSWILRPMHDPIVHHILRAYPAAAAVEEAPFRPSASLRCAEKGKGHYLAHADFALAYCQHDGADSFIAVLEIHARTALEFPVECTHHDLHGCYLEQGEISASQGDGKLTLYTAQYTFVYAPRDEYRVRIEAGMTIVRLWSTNDRSLVRDRAKNDLRPLGTLLNQWVDKKPCCHHSRILPIGPACASVWDKISLLPQLRPLTMDNRLRDLVSELIYCAVDTLNKTRQDQNKSLRLAHDLRSDIVQALKTGHVLTIKSLHIKYGFSEQYLQRLHHKFYLTSIKAFVTRLRLQQGKFLLANTGIPIETIAYTVGYGSEAEFINAFTAFHGVHPSSIRKK